ncbi:hypothetical protein Ancab_003186 [Ancistrocladus abbreviatus]
MEPVLVPDVELCWLFRSIIWECGSALLQISFIWMLFPNVASGRAPDLYCFTVMNNDCCYEQKWKRTNSPLICAPLSASFWSSSTDESHPQPKRPKPPPQRKVVPSQSDGGGNSSPPQPLQRIKINKASEDNEKKLSLYRSCYFGISLCRLLQYYSLLFIYPINYLVHALFLYD